MFGVALEPTFLEAGHEHLLVAEILGRDHPGVEGIYPEARRRAESEARLAVTEADGREISLALIGDHLHGQLAHLALRPEAVATNGRPLSSDRSVGRDASAAAVAPFDALVVAQQAIETEVRLLQTLGRANPRAIQLHLAARERGVATALVADTPLPRDLIARIARACGYQADHIVVSSNEGRQKGSGLYGRLLAAGGGVEPDNVVHLGPDLELDVNIPRSLGIDARHAPDRAPDKGPPLLLGLTRPRGLGSIALNLADRHRQRTRRAGDLSWRRLSSEPGLDAADLGYYAGGPLLAGFAAWVGAQIDDLSPDEVVLCGFAGGLVDHALAVLRPDLPRERRHRLPVTADGRCPVHQLAATVPLARCRRILVVDLGLFEQPHPEIRERLGALAPTPEIHGAYLGTLSPALPGARTWAFAPPAALPRPAGGHVNGDHLDNGTGHRIGPEAAPPPHHPLSDPAGGHGPALLRVAANRPEILQALLHRLPGSIQDVPPALRPFHAGARALTEGTMAFVEDVEPWLHLEAGTLSGTMAEPALRVISAPTAAEAAVLGPYPAFASEGESKTALIPGSALGRPGAESAGDHDARWIEGARALAEAGLDRRRRRVFGRH